MKDLSFGDTHRTFAEKVIDILKAENIKFTTLAKEVGENVSTIKNCLYGRRRIKKDIAEKICDYLKVDYYEMTKDDDYLNTLNPKKSLSFGQKLSNLLTSKGILQSDLAEILGVSESTISNIVNDKYDIKKDTLVKICNTLNVDMYEMLKDDPKYSYLKEEFKNKVSILSIFRSVGINNPKENYETILMDLINDNKQLFIDSDNQKDNSNNIKADNSKDVFNKLNNNGYTIV